MPFFDTILRCSVSLIKPLTLGSLSFPVNIIQGPLAGVSCAPFRRLIWRYSQPAFACTEMISCKTLLHKPIVAQRRFIEKDKDEGPVCFQLSSSDPAELAQAVERVTGFGADLIDLNCGCPVKKIRKRGAGSRLLAEPEKLYQLICAMKVSTHVPVSVKIRVDGGSGDQFNGDMVNMLRSAAPDFVVVHGRHHTEHYETACQYEQIQYFVENLDMPVIGNGDIACVDSLRAMLQTGCAGVMIARAGVGQPWLIAQLISELSGKSYALPSRHEIGQLFLEHIYSLVDLLANERFAVYQARTLIKYYARSLPHRQALCAKVNLCQSISELALICAEVFTDKG